MLESSTTALKTSKEVITDKVQELKRVLDWHDLPKWMQIDPLLRRGYRRQLDSFRACFRSLFYTHNEFVNIWSHLLPGLCYLVLLTSVEYSLARKIKDESMLDVMMVQMYIAGTAGCLCLSAFYHSTNAHSARVARQSLKCDYSGIILNITVTNLSSTYFGLRDELFLQRVYMGICLICATGVLRSLLGPNADGPKMAQWRAVICGALIGTGFIPIAHKLIRDGIRGLDGFPMVHIGITILCYFVGAVIYVAHIPEKYWPGTFDIWGASHQIFHVLVAIGQMSYLIGLREKVNMRYA